MVEDMNDEDAELTDGSVEENKKEERDEEQHKRRQRVSKLILAWKE